MTGVQTCALPIYSTPPRQARQDHVYLEENGEFKQQRRPQLRKRPLNGTVALLQTFSRLFHLVQFVKFWQFFLELNLKRLYRSSGKGKEKENRCLAAFLFLSRLKLGMSCSDGKEMYKKA